MSVLSGVLLTAVSLVPFDAADEVQQLLEYPAAEAVAELEELHEKHPNDDRVRMGLGVGQLFAAADRLATDLETYGLRSDRVGLFFDRMRVLNGDLGKAEAIGYEDLRQVIERFGEGVAAAEATLAAVADESVKLPLYFERIGVAHMPRYLPDLRRNMREPARAGGQVTADFGDVQWLRGYCHFVCGWCELLLAVDGKDQFERTGHLLFAKPKTPYPFLLEQEPDFRRFDRPSIADAVAFLHTSTLDVKEPERMTAALEHFRAMVGRSRAMWTHYLAETDDDHEWIPNPDQTSVTGTPVSAEMVQTWRTVLDEADQVLAGERLIPFWRGSNPKRGMNLRRVFTEPTTLDPVLWFQGTAATPYLEEGEPTTFADPDMLRSINRSFGRPDRFFGFALWFN